MVLNEEKSLEYRRQRYNGRGDWAMFFLYARVGEAQIKLTLCRILPSSGGG